MIIKYIGAAIGLFSGSAAGSGASHFIEPALCARDVSEFILNRDFGIIEDDDDQTLIKEAQKLNPKLGRTEGLVIHDKTGVSARIKATSSSVFSADSSVEVKYLVQRNLYNTTELLKEWQAHFVKFLSELSRQAKEDVGNYDLSHQKTWQDDKNFQIRSLLIDLHQSLAIIRIDDYVKKLYKRVLTLENDLAKLEETIEKMQNEANCAGLSKKLDYVPSAASGFDKLSKSVPMIINAIPKSAAIVPVVGYIFTGISTLNSVYCFLQK